MAKHNATIEERFWPKVKVGLPSECWLWQGAKRPRGYGVILLNGKHMLAHRVSYLLSKGRLPEGKYICHHCDNPPCVNPAHLFPGDADDNAKDAVRKGRILYHPRKDPNWKMPSFIPWLTVLKIREAHSGGETSRQIATRLALSMGRVQGIVQHCNYLHPHPHDHAYRFHYGAGIPRTVKDCEQFLRRQAKLAG